MERQTLPADIRRCQARPKLCPVQSRLVPGQHTVDRDPRQRPALQRVSLVPTTLPRTIARPRFRRELASQSGQDSSRSRKEFLVTSSAGGCQTQEIVKPKKNQYERERRAG